MTSKNSISRTRTTKTEGQYFNNYKRIVLACYRYKHQIPEPNINKKNPSFLQSSDEHLRSKENQTPPFGLCEKDLSAVDFAEFFAWKSNEIKKATFNQYLASISYGLGLRGGESLNKFKELVGGLRENCEPNAKKKYTSSIKKKKLSDVEVIALKKVANQSTKLIDKRLAIFILASVYTGLRPSEFANAIYENGSLFVLNGKNSNGRSTGEIRSVPVSTEQWKLFLDINQVQLGEDLAAFIENTEEDRIYFAEESLNQVSFIVGGACTFPTNEESELRKEKLESFFASSSSKRFLDWEQRPCPYTGRHMFSANWKNVLSKGSLALLMGHASDETAGFHYARRTQGLPIFREHFAERSMITNDKPQSIEREGTKQ